jgi:hypothetical protein
VQIDQSRERKSGRSILFFNNYNRETRVMEKGLDDRQRDKDGRIRQKSGSTLVITLRKEYGEHFAKGYPAETKLSELLVKEKCNSLHEYLNRHK